MSLRLKGQECKLRFAAPDGPIEAVVKIADFEVTMLGEILEEQYTGEDTPDFDSISNGIHVKATIHWSDPTMVDFFDKVDRKRKRIDDAAGKFSAVAILKFPTGRTRKGLINDIEFGDFGAAIRGRKDYVSTALEGKAARIKWI